MHVFIIYANLLLVASSLVMNLIALVVFLASWRLYFTRRAKVTSSDKVGYLVYLALIVDNVLCLILCKISLIYQHWEGSGFLFGETTCQWTLILNTSLSLVQFVTANVYLANVALRLKKIEEIKTSMKHLASTSLITNGHSPRYAESMSLISPISKKANDTFSKVKEAFCVILSSLGLTLVIGIVVMYKLRLDPNTKKDDDICRSQWQDILWLTLVHWLFGFVGPLGLIALPAFLSLWIKWRTVPGQMKPFISLSSVIICTQVLLSIPSIVFEVEAWLQKSDHYDDFDNDSGALKPSSAFVKFILTSILTDLQFLYTPLGIMLIPPTSFSCKKPSHVDDHKESEDPEQMESLAGRFSSKFKRRRGKSQNDLRYPDKNHHDAINDEESSSMLDLPAMTTDVVTADIHQRLSRSQTTVV